MHITDVLKFKFPNIDFVREVRLQDDGEGVYIAGWFVDGVEKPTDETLALWANEVQPSYEAEQRVALNKHIYEQLDVLDVKSIRALRTNDTQRLAQIEQQAAALRKQLV